MRTSSRHASVRRWTSAFAAMCLVVGGLAAMPAAAQAQSSTSAHPSASAAAAVGQDVARSGTATAKSYYTLSGDFKPANAIDGDPATRWGSRYTRTGPNDTYDPKNDWLQVQLAAAAKVDHVVITWEAASSTDYFVQGSNDGTNWTDLAHVSGLAAGARTDTVPVTDQTAYLYVRMQSNNNAGKYGLSIWSFQVWNGPEAPPPTPGQVVPAPVSQEQLAGDPFTLAADSRIVIGDPALQSAADMLAGTLRTSTGYDLPVTSGTAGAHDISLQLGAAPAGATADYAIEQGYTLRASADGAVITGHSANGVFDGTQTLLQLLPAWAYASQAVVADWSIAATEVVDYPRLKERGIMLDPARNFIPKANVYKAIDRLVQIKGNRLHLHLTDDEGWRLEIPGYPQLTEVGSTSSYDGPTGSTGFYTLQDFRDIIAYANARFVEVIPEVDIPGHSDAALASYPQLVCDNQVAAYTTATNGIAIRDSRRNATGFPLCNGEQFTWDMIGTVIDTIAANSPSQYIHVGGDEVDSAKMSHADYVAFLQHVEQLVAAKGKKMIGWTPVPVAAQLDSTVHQYWADRKNQILAPASDPTHIWYSRGSEVVVSPTNNAYLDYGFESGNSWSWKGSTWTTQFSYNWDPSSVVDETTKKNQNTALGLQESQISAVEGALWGERQSGGLKSLDYQAWTRLAGLNEKGWSPKALSGDWSIYQQRLAQMGPRWTVQGVNFWADPAVTWANSAAGLAGSAAAGVAFTGDVALLATPRVAHGQIAVSVDWGDGSAATTGTVSGTDAAKQQAASVFTVNGSHTYTSGGAFRGTVTATLPGGARIVTPFEITVTAADLTAADQAIAQARSLLNSTAVGTGYGQVPQAAHDALQVALDDAEGRRESAVSQADADGIVTDLSAAIAAFQQAIIDDTTAPVTTADVSDADPAVVTLTAADEAGGSGIAKTEYRIGDEGDWSTYAAPFSVPLTDQAQTVQFRSVDKAGNTETTKSQAIPARTIDPGTCTTEPFWDVPTDSDFCADIKWLTSTGIATGYTDPGHELPGFHPAAAVSRQAMAAFLYRAANPGKTAPACTTQQFWDVPVDAPFCAEIAWLASTGITTGYTDAGHELPGFHPTAEVSRQAMAAFLFRFADEGEKAPACQSQEFWDVATDASFCAEIGWLASTGITTGYTDDGQELPGFHPVAPVTRQAMAAFLHRANDAGIIDVG